MAALLVFAGTWLSGYFIVCTNAWMQHPVGFVQGPDGTFQLASIWALLFNPWALPQYLHVMLGSVVTASLVMASITSFYLLRGEHEAVARRMLSVAVIAALA